MAASPRAYRAPAPLRLVVMGVSGAGKSSVASALAGRFGLACIDGDDSHPRANVAKMRSGTPLDDGDRCPWLDRVAASLAAPSGVVVACSALKRAYRDRIRDGVPTGLRFVFLDVASGDVEERLRARASHFMPPSLMDSQFATLERPAGDEVDVIAVAATRPVHDLVDEISRRLAGRNTAGNTRHG